MLIAFLNRLFFSKFLPTAIMVAQLLGWVTFSQAAESSSANPPPPPPPVAPRTVRRALREFDRFLDHHPLPEDELRRDPALMTNHAFLDGNPELGNFLNTNPEVLTGLKTYPRYFLYRALLRQASVPLRYSEIAEFKALFDSQPGLEQALVRNPELVRDPRFLQASAPLHDFIVQHPVLKDAFLSRLSLSDKTL
jgi:hypothetical protein